MNNGLFPLAPPLGKNVIQLWRSTNLSLSNNIWTLVPFDTIIDMPMVNMRCFEWDGNTSIYIKSPGYYLVETFLSLSGSISYCYGKFGGSIDTIAGKSGYSGYFTLSSQIPLNVGDYVNIQVYVGGTTVGLISTNWAQSYAPRLVISRC